MLLNKSFIRNLSISAVRSAKIGKVTVVGAGLLGTGIAQVVAQSGMKITLVDKTDDLLKKGANVIAASLTRNARKKENDEAKVTKSVQEIMRNLSFSTDTINSCKSTDLVIEAIIEDLKVKQEYFKKIEQIVPSSTIFASNTSGLSIESIAEATNRRDKFAGLHFFHPVIAMKLVEIVSPNEVSKETKEILTDFCKDINKIAVHCKDTTGFIVNRLTIPLVLEAARMAERGDASIEDIDVAMKLGCGYPLGPFEACDLVGIDTFNLVVKDWHKRHPEQTLFNTVDLISQKVKEGKFGRKSGEGFFVYKK